MVCGKEEELGAPMRSGVTPRHDIDANVMFVEMEQKDFLGECPMYVCVKTCCCDCDFLAAGERLAPRLFWALLCLVTRLTPVSFQPTQAADALP